MKIWIVSPLLFIFISCASGPSRAGREQVHCEMKIDQLKEKIYLVRNSLESSEENLRQLKARLEEEEITRIRLRLESFAMFLPELKENKEKYSRFLKEEISSLFLEEREQLIEIIHSSAAHHLEAQELLDRILRLITQLKS